MLYTLSTTNLNGEMRFRNGFPPFFLSYTHSLSLSGRTFFFKRNFLRLHFSRFNEKSKMEIFGAYFNNSAIQSGSQQIFKSHTVCSRWMKRKNWMGKC